MSDHPAVRLRVVMPVHNSVRYVRQALDSALADLPDDAELIVVDDGSSDGSSGIVAAVAAQDARVRIIRHDTARGVSAALNAGIDAPGDAEYLAVAEHDDVVLSGRFAAQLAALDADDRLGAVSGEGTYVGPNGRLAGRVAVGPATREEFETMRAAGREILIPHPAITYRTRALHEIGGYDSSFDGAQDLELINRLVYQGGWAVQRLSGRHVLYRIHGSAMSFSHLAEQRTMTRYVRYRNQQQLAGAPFPAYRKWADAEQPDPRTARRLRRYDRGALMYRRAGFAWITRRPFAFAGNLVGASVLHPRWVLAKIKVARGG